LQAFLLVDRPKAATARRLKSPVGATLIAQATLCFVPERRIRTVAAKSGVIPQGEALTH
jgi:hypothetical protein